MVLLVLFYMLCFDKHGCFPSACPVLFLLLDVGPVLCVLSFALVCPNAQYHDTALFYARGELRRAGEEG